MAGQLPGRDDEFFFRENELRWLINRLNYPGITVISGRTRTGKSWLVGQALRHAIENSPEALIGFTRCSGQDSDNFMRVIEDLYTRWRKQAHLLDQAKATFNNARSKWPQLIVTAVGAVLDAVNPIGDFSELTSAALHGVLELQPGSQVPRLKYEQGQQLVAVLAEITQSKPVILALDQWEQSENLRYEVELLGNFSRDSRDWPDTHFLITIKPGDGAEKLLDKLCKGQEGFAEIYELPLFDIETDSDEKIRLIKYLRDTVPACRTVGNPEDYLKSLQGYAAVLDNWTRHINRDQMQDLDDLLEVADQAQQGRYPEFDDKLPQLDDASRKLCIRLALLPDTTEQNWPVLKPILEDGIKPSCLDQLYADKFLEVHDPPSFGHQSRSDYLQNWLIEHRKNETGKQCALLIGLLAAEIQDLSPANLPQSEALASLEHLAQRLEIDPLSRGLCEAASSLLRAPVSGIAILEAVSQIHDGKQAEFARLVAMGLVNALNFTKTDMDLHLRDAQLDALQTLQQRYPDDAMLRESRAMGLCNTLNEAEDGNSLPRRDVSLDEIRALQQDYPNDVAVRKQLALGLWTTFGAANDGGDQPRRDELLEELRELQKGYSDDATVREVLAKALFTGRNAANDGGDQPRRDELLEELRELQKGYSDDATVREVLASGLRNARCDAKREANLRRRGALLRRLLVLQKNYPDDAAVREVLAIGLVDTLTEKLVEGDLPRHDALLKELRELQKGYSDDTTVREWWAKGLNNAMASNNLPRRDELLEELRQLLNAYPDDYNVIGITATALYQVAYVLLLSEQRDNEIEPLMSEARELFDSIPDGHPVKAGFDTQKTRTQLDSIPDGHPSKAMFCELLESLSGCERDE